MCFLKSVGGKEVFTILQLCLNQVLLVLLVKVVVAEALGVVVEILTLMLSPVHRGEEQQGVPEVLYL